LEDFLHGEGYLKSPELVKEFVEAMPIMEIPAKYVVFKPLNPVAPEKEGPGIVIFLATPEQLSALLILANYGRDGTESVIIPYAAGCQTIAASLLIKRNDLKILGQSWVLQIHRQERT